jgi:hypothetical protein
MALYRITTTTQTATNIEVLAIYWLEVIGATLTFIAIIDAPTIALIEAQRAFWEMEGEFVGGGTNTCREFKITI